MLKQTLSAALALALLASFSLPASAASHHKLRVRGTVESIDQTARTFTVREDGKSVAFKIDERSEFELEHRDRHDEDVAFGELKVGDRVKVKAFKGEQPHLVDDVDIYR